MSSRREFENLKKILIVGLGNPLKHLENTRHNAGKKLVKKLAKSLNIKFEDFKTYKKGEKVLKNKKVVILAYPLLFMNQSGKAVLDILKDESLSAENLIVLRDDTDIFLGNFKLKFNSGSGGHKGVKSIIQSLKTQKFWQLKIGVRLSKEKEKAEKLVLTTPPREIKKKLSKVLDKLVKFIHSEILG